MAVSSFCAAIWCCSDCCFPCSPVTLSAIPSNQPSTTFIPCPSVCVRTCSACSSEKSCCEDSDTAEAREAGERGAARETREGEAGIETAGRRVRSAKAESAAQRDARHECIRPLCSACGRVSGAGVPLSTVSFSAFASSCCAIDANLSLLSVV
eukprot:6158955-Prymnesium_polylepis.1